MTPLMILGLVLVLLILAGNTMLAIGFLRSKGGWKGIQGRDDEAMDELHKRVQSLPPRHN